MCAVRPSKSVAVSAALGKRMASALLLLAPLIALTFAQATPAIAAPPQEEQLEQFLARLGLSDLRVLQLEKMVSGPNTPQGRISLAKKLADLYAGQLMAAADNVPRYDATLAKIQELTTRVPEARTASLSVILLQADYNRAETLMSKWISDPKETAARNEAQRILTEITPSLMQRRSELTKHADALTKKLDELEEGDRAFALNEKELARTQAVIGRASYFAAWSNYYLGLLKGSGAAEIDSARIVFKKLLGIDSYDEVEAEWLALESIWRARSLIGLGLSEAAAGDLASSKTCFNLLRHASVSTEIQDQAPYWYVRGMLNAGKLGETLGYARSEIANFAGRATQGKVSLCVALVRAGYADPKATGLAKELGQLGISGLAKLGQQKAIGQLVKQYGISLKAPAGFYLNWIKGRQLADEARADKDQDKYREAAQAMEQALQASDAQENVRSAANCRYELGWCYYQLAEYERAGRAYEQALIGLKAAKEATAPEAAWMSFVSYNKLAAKNGRFASRAIDVLRGLKKSFPEHRYAEKADYFIAKLQRAGGSPEQAVRNLMSIPPSNPQYLSARYDLCVLLHRQWAEKRDNTDLAKKLQLAVDEFAPQAKDDRWRMRVLLLAADAAMTQKTPNWAMAAQRLTAAKSPASKVPANDALQAEYHFRLLQLATHESNDVSRKREARWLVENGGGSPYELAALVIVAKSLEKQIKAATAAAKPGLASELVGVYRRLSSRYGTSIDTLTSSKNARVAASRLAQYELDAGRPSDSAAVLIKLLAAFPKETTYIRRAGLAQFQAGNFADAIEHWRVLARGLPKGKPAWCEAKYYQIACLAKSDQASAKRTLKQYQLLYPDFGDPSYRSQFQQLAASLGL